MIKVFENFELAIVGQFQSVFEAEGIRTHIKNQFMSGVLGEIPFVSAVPELWILNDEDLDEAKALISKLQEQVPQVGEDWTCSSCGSDVDGVFDQCWKCSTPKKDLDPGSDQIQGE